MRPSVGTYEEVHIFSWTSVSAKRGRTQSPTLTLVTQKAGKDVGKLSEMKKGRNAKHA